MMTLGGAQRVLNYRVSRHNFEKFLAYIQEIEAKNKRHRNILNEKLKESSLM